MTTFDVLNYLVNDGSMRGLSAGNGSQVDQDEIVETYLVHSSSENHQFSALQFRAVVVPCFWNSLVALIVDLTPLLSACCLTHCQHDGVCQNLKC